MGEGWPEVRSFQRTPECARKLVHRRHFVMHGEGKESLDPIRKLYVCHECGTEQYDEGGKRTQGPVPRTTDHALRASYAVS